MRTNSDHLLLSDLCRRAEAALEESALVIKSLKSNSFVLDATIERSKDLGEPPLFVPPYRSPFLRFTLRVCGAAGPQTRVKLPSARKKIVKPGQS